MVCRALEAVDAKVLVLFFCMDGSLDMARHVFEPISVRLIQTVDSM